MSHRKTDEILGNLVEEAIQASWSRGSHIAQSIRENEEKVKETLKDIKTHLYGFVISTCDYT